MPERPQYFKECKRCHRQILMTYSSSKGKWIACDPELRRYRRSGGPETFVTPEGEVCYGVKAYDGEYGYRKHRRDCV